MELTNPTEAQLKYQFHVIVRVQTAWFVAAAFPSLLLVYDVNSCVSFQGIAPWLDFAAIQVLFVVASLSLFAPRMVERGRFIRYQKVVATINALVQLGAATVHVRGLTSGGAGLRTACFRVDFGGVWYVVAVNIGGVVLFVSQFLILAKLGRESAASAQTGHTVPSGEE